MFAHSSKITIYKSICHSLTYFRDRSFIKVCQKELKNEKYPKTLQIKWALNEIHMKIQKSQFIILHPYFFLP